MKRTIAILLALAGLFTAPHAAAQHDGQYEYRLRNDLLRTETIDDTQALAPTRRYSCSTGSLSAGGRHSSGYGSGMCFLPAGRYAGCAGPVFPAGTGWSMWLSGSTRLAANPIWTGMSQVMSGAGGGIRSLISVPMYPVPSMTACDG